EELPDLILLDILMPAMDGFEVLKILRANPATEKVRVVILSALNSNEDIVKGYNLGANDFITKPIIMEKHRENHCVQRHRDGPRLGLSSTLLYRRTAAECVWRSAHR
ncbi:MAG: response regulator, partial [Shewanella sp.]|nr:response regulator [Shewanella sp.]